MADGMNWELAVRYLNGRIDGLYTAMFCAVVSAAVLHPKFADLFVENLRAQLPQMKDNAAEFQEAHRFLTSIERLIEERIMPGLDSAKSGQDPQPGSSRTSIP